jgi:single-strand DNA-binding protein
MKTMNKVFLIGHLGNDPELKTSENGIPFLRLSVATHRSRGKNNEFETVVQWHSVYVWGNQAENCAKWLSKGSLVFVEGEVRQIEPKESSDERPLSLIHAHEVKFLNTKQGNLDNRLHPRNHDAVAQR